MQQRRVAPKSCTAFAPLPPVPYDMVKGLARLPLSTASTCVLRRIAGCRSGARSRFCFAMTQTGQLAAHKFTGQRCGSGTAPREARTSARRSSSWSLDPSGDRRQQISRALICGSQTFHDALQNVGGNKPRFCDIKVHVYLVFFAHSRLLSLVVGLKERLRSLI